MDLFGYIDIVSCHLLSQILCKVFIGLLWCLKELLIAETSYDVLCEVDIVLIKFISIIVCTYSAYYFASTRYSFIDTMCLERIFLVKWNIKNNL